MFSKLICAGVLVFLLVHSAAAEVPANRLATLSRGVNFINTFEKPIPVIVNDIATVHRAGFRHIRIMVDPAWVWRSGEPEHLDQVVHAALAAKLGVILVMHSYDHYISDDPQTLERWNTAWKRLASHYANTNPDLLFFELVNEPPFQDMAHWVAIQEKFRQQVRSVAPHNTLLLTGTPTSTSVALTGLPPSSDDNVVYTFHLYAPMAFTHQGADFAGPNIESVHGLQYPPSEPNLANVEQRATPAERPELAKFGQQGTGVLPTEITPAADWARKNNAHLIVTEFGVYRTAPAASRVRWLHDARVTLEKFDIGWTIWEYDGGFGIKPDIEFGCGPVSIALGLCSQDHR